VNRFFVRVSLVAALALAITALHYGTAGSEALYHVIYRDLSYFPILLAALWFGLRGGLAASLVMSALYIPFLFLHWQGLDAGAVDRIMEVLLFNVMAVAVGLLRDREVRREREKRQALTAMAGGVAHEMNSPMAAALSAAQMLEEDLAHSEQEGVGPMREDAATIVRNLKAMRDLVRRVAELDRFETAAYVGSDTVMRLGETGAGREGRDND
jgi:signal transduction histidine kinase